MTLSRCSPNFAQGQFDENGTGFLLSEKQSREQVEFLRVAATLVGVPRDEKSELSRR